MKRSKSLVTSDNSAYNKKCRWAESGSKIPFNSWRQKWNNLFASSVISNARNTNLHTEGVTLLKRAIYSRIFSMLIFISNAYTYIAKYVRPLTFKTRKSQAPRYHTQGKLWTTAELLNRIPPKNKLQSKRSPNYFLFD